MTVEHRYLARDEPHEPATGKGARTRRRLLDEARVVFERDGYHAARVSDIAGGAGVSQGTFYKYFRSKDDVFRSLTNQVVVAMMERTRRREHEPDPLRRITLANWRYLAAYRDDAAILAVVWQVMAEDDYREFWVRVRQDWADTLERWVTAEVEHGGADPRLDPRIAARALGLMMETFAHHWFVLGEEYDDVAALATLTQLWVNALRLDLDARVTEGLEQLAVEVIASLD